MTWDILWGLANGDNFSQKIERMCICGEMLQFIPEIHDMYFGLYPHYKHHHPEGGLKNHFMGVLRLLDNSTPIVKLAGLFHDIGKPSAFKYDLKGVFNYIGHDAIGCDIFNNIASQLNIPNTLSEEIAYSIKNHMKMHKFLEMRLHKCCKLIDSPYWATLYAVSYADDLSRLYLYDRYLWNKIDDKILQCNKIINKEV